MAQRALSPLSPNDAMLLNELNDSAALEFASSQICFERINLKAVATSMKRA